MKTIEYIEKKIVEKVPVRTTYTCDVCGKVIGIHDEIIPANNRKSCRIFNTELVVDTRYGDNISIDEKNCCSLDCLKSVYTSFSEYAKDPNVVCELIVNDIDVRVYTEESVK